LKIRTVKELLDARLIVGEDFLDQEVLSGCGSDLMSDVLAFVKEQTVLLTGLNNPQVIRTAEVLDVSAIVFVRGKTPSPEVIEMAIERDIVLLSTDDTLFEACGKLYQGGLRGG